MLGRRAIGQKRRGRIGMQDLEIGIGDGLALGVRGYVRHGHHEMHVEVGTGTEPDRRGGTMNESDFASCYIFLQSHAYLGICAIIREGTCG